MARSHGPYYPIASSPGMVTRANPATWAGRGIIVSLWEIVLVDPFPVLALGPGTLVPRSWVGSCAIGLGARGVRGGQSRDRAATGELLSSSFSSGAL